MNLPRFEVKCQQLAIKRSFFSDTLCNTIMSLALEPIYKMFPVALQNVPCLHRHFGFVILSHKSKWQTYHRREWTAFKGEEGRFWSVNTFTFLIAVQRSCRLAANAFPTQCRLFFFFSFFVKFEWLDFFWNEEIVWKQEEVLSVAASWWRINKCPVVCCCCRCNAFFFWLLFKRCTLR